MLPHTHRDIFAWKVMADKEKIDTEKRCHHGMVEAFCNLCKKHNKGEWGTNQVKGGLRGKKMDHPYRTQSSGDGSEKTSVETSGEEDSAEVFPRSHFPRFSSSPRGTRPASKTKLEFRLKESPIVASRRKVVPFPSEQNKESPIFFGKGFENQNDGYTRQIVDKTTTELRLMGVPTLAMICSILRFAPNLRELTLNCGAIYSPEVPKVRAELRKRHVLITDTSQA